MLWVNFVNDTLGSLALAIEKPTKDLLKRKPYGRTKSLITPKIARNMLGHAFYQLTILLILLFAGDIEFNCDVLASVQVPRGLILSTDGAGRRTPNLPLILH